MQYSREDIKFIVEVVTKLWKNSIIEPSITMEYYQTITKTKTARAVQSLMFCKLNHFTDWDMYLLPRINNDLGYI